MSDGRCYECESPTDDACVRCERATCSEHFFEQEHLGLCEACKNELEEHLARSNRGLTHWPWPVRKPMPGMYDPSDPPADVEAGPG